jgi:hypothetical protein
MIFAAIANAQNWKPAQCPLTTPWTDKVDPTNPWPEYPRPQMVRERWQNLNGLWDYAIAPRLSEKPNAWEGKILVPFAIESSLSGVGKTVGKDQTLWYRRSFLVENLKSDERLLLHFGAVDWRTDVYINGTNVCAHEGGYDSFSCDITEHLIPGENELIVSVWDPTDADSQPRGKQVSRPEGIWYTSVTGIWQTVWLEPVPATRIESFRFVPDVDAGELRVIVNASPESDVELAAFDGKTQVASSAGRSGSTIILKISDAKLWSPDSPFLYDLKIAIKRDGKVLDQISSYFAMRKISTGKGAGGYLRLMLNDKPIFHLGPLDQGWWPDGLYTAPTDDALKFDIEMTRKLGLNMCRKHIKVEPARWYYWADKLGLMVWQDMPSACTSGIDRYWVRSNASEDASFSPIEHERFTRELKAMIDQLHNFPCVVVWVPFNEGWGQHQTNEVLEWVKRYDPTRLVNGPSGWEDRGFGDMHDMHKYPGPGMFPVSPDRVSVLGEFGGLGLPLTNHVWQEQKNWGYRTYQSSEELLDNYTLILSRLAPLASQGLSAGIYTQTTDVEGEVNGYLTYDRRVTKLDVAKLNELHQAVYRASENPKKCVVLLATSEDQPQEYRFTTAPPAEKWHTLQFDDSAWQSAPGAFGTAKDHRAVRTEWKSTDIWLRRTFESDGAALTEPQLRIWHDEDAEVYLNGQLVASLKGFARDYDDVPIAGVELKKGRNLLAIHCRQTIGGQGIDAGLSDLRPIAK